ncbi:MAG: electron transport complex subunit RsxB [Rubrivivax sp.]
MPSNPRADPAANPGPVPASVTLAARIDAVLPQTQCTRCGEPDCRRYAEAVARGQAPLNRCPPGGQEGIARLSQVTGLPPLPLDPAHGIEGPLRLALIDEDWCIGCTLCIKACPVDAIVGGSKRMHTVIASECTGCELCLPVCPVDCIQLVTPAPDRHGWAAWSEGQAERARARYGWHTERTERDRQEHDALMAERAKAKLADLSAHSQIDDPEALARKRAVVEAAMARARQRSTS